MAFFIGIHDHRSIDKLNTGDNAVFVLDQSHSSRKLCKQLVVTYNAGSFNRLQTGIHIVVFIGQRYDLVCRLVNLFIVLIQRLAVHIQSFSVDLDHIAKLNNVLVIHAG